MEDNSDCATSIFSLALFSPFVWLFAIIIIFLHLARANPRRMCSCLAYCAASINVVNGLCGKWMEKGRPGRSRGSLAIFSSIMTAEIARDRKTNRVDYQHDSAVALFHLAAKFFCSFFSHCVLQADLTVTLNVF